MLEDNQHSASYIEKHINAKKKYQPLRANVEYIPVVDDPLKNSDADSSDLLLEYKRKAEEMIDIIATQSRTATLEQDHSSLHSHVRAKYPLPTSFFKHLHEANKSKRPVSETDLSVDSSPSIPSKKLKIEHSPLELQKIKFAYLKHQQLHLKGALDNHLVSKHCLVLNRNLETSASELKSRLDQSLKNSESLDKYNAAEIYKNIPVIESLNNQWKEQLIKNINDDLD
ncbi:hypothetical protein ACO0QE_003183 [Hanseniaspora vineae]